MDVLTEYEKEVLHKKVETLQEINSKLREEIEQSEAQLSETKLSLDKENARYHSACRQQQVSAATRLHVQPTLKHSGG